MTDASTFFPGQLYQNPDGTFSLDVTGHLHAQGLDLDAGQSTTPPSQDRIRWLRADGGVVADLTTESNQGALDITAYSFAPGDEAVVSLNARNQQGHRSAEMSLVQSGEDPPSFSQVVLTSEGSGAGSGIFLQIAPPAPAKTLLDSTGASDWLQAPTVSQPGVTVNSIRQPNTTHATLVLIEHNFIIAAGQSESYQILIGSASPPVTLIDEPFSNIVGQITATTAFLIPAAWFYQLKLLAHTGSAGFRFTEWTL